MNQYQIIWEKWNDPFGEDMDELKWNNYEHENDDDENFYEKVSKFQKPVKVISSPLGLIPYNEHTASSKIFNFWVGHTNFNISKKIINIIEQCDGVELLDVFTRYRFRIGVGKCFVDSNVMSEISEKTIPLVENFNGQ